ncbi:MAG TPA: ABC transporter permease [Vicinamibacterales bacterium]|nr:ABC transporter permease [Vicinamibacterales bacterium]
MHVAATSVLQDLRHAARLLRREPGYTATAVLAIALGIGASTTLFSVTYGVLLKPLPWRDPEHLIRLEERRGGRTGRIPWTITNGTYNAWRDNAATLEALGGWMSMPGTFSDGGGEPERIRLGRLTPSVFTVLDARAFIGRVFDEHDAATRQADTVILAHGFWQRRFGGAADIVGRSVRLDYRPYTVVGVMPQGFAFPDRETQAWTPAHIAPLFSEDGTSISLQIFGAIARVRPGVTPEQAAAEGTARARTARDPGAAALALFGSSEPPAITATPALEVMIAEVRPAIRILFAAVLLLFFTAVASVATMQLARVAKRRREMTIRAALGASTPRLARQWLTESAVVGAGGGILGIIGARLIIAVLPAILPGDFPRLSEVALDWRVALAATAATLAAIAVCGLVPAFQARRIDLAQSLADDNLAPVGGLVRTPAARLRAAIMAGQIAVACVLLIGAGLLGRSLQSLINVDRGYDLSNLLTARLPLPPGSAFEKNGALLEAIAARLRALPGVTHASFGNALPLVSAGGMSGFSTRLPRDPSTVAKVQTLHRTVDPAYFTAMGLRLRAGRLLTDSDTVTAQPVLVVNKSFADQYLGDDPIGRRLSLSLYRQAEWEVVGVIEDMKQGGLETAGFVRTADAAQPEMFSSYRQFPEMRPDNMFFVARAASDPSALASALRAIVREQAPALVVESVMTMEDRLMSSLARPRAYALVLGGLAAFALAIALVGLFGVLSYSVAQRSREIGVRTALGARPSDVVALVLRSAMTITAAGLIVGVVAAGLLAGSLAKILYGVEPYDPATFIAAPVVLALAAAVACAAPARRAARLDPVRALWG